MKRNFRLAFNALEKIGAPVFENADTERDGNFRISAENNVDETWASYWAITHSDLDNGVNRKITSILRRYGLFSEWQNAACLSVWEA